MSSTGSDRTLAALRLALAVVGVVHLLAPDALLGVACVAYDRVLAVEFEPRPAATTRVRLVGVGFLAVAAALGRLAGR
ncbi:MAG: hypothetical protein ABEJ79_01155 [Halolamina sp.]